MTKSDGGRPPEELVVHLTGELTTITDRRRVRLELDPDQPLTWREALCRLAQESHPWFGELAASPDGFVPGLGAVLLVLDGHLLDLCASLDQPVRAGELYVIPPIPGGCTSGPA